MKGGVVSVEEIASVWPHVESLIEAACVFNGDRYSASDYLNAFLEGRKQLWVAAENGVKGVVVSQIVQFPRKKCCSIDICTGEDLKDWGHLVSLVEDWARLQGCIGMFLTARPGMKPLLKQNNYNGSHILMEKVL